MDLVKKILKGDQPSLARAISLVENRSTQAIKLLEGIYPYVGKAHRIGITGPPGVGKSTLTNELGELIRQKHQTLGVIAIDPTSVFTGGAILGDRIRMQKIGSDQGIFIRSMATRGYSGGISQATTEASDILDASGKDYIIIETVGVGQSEIDVFKNVDITIVILSPESGDAIQVMKSGLLEIADIIVVNKADRPEVDSLVNSLKTLNQSRFRAELRPHLTARQVRPEDSKGEEKHQPTLRTLSPSLDPEGRDENPEGLGKITLAEEDERVLILKTEAINGIGVKELFEHLGDQLSHLERTGRLQEKRHKALLDRLKSLISARLEEAIWMNQEIVSTLEKAVHQITMGKQTPYRAVDEVIKTVTQRFKSHARGIMP